MPSENTNLALNSLAMDSLLAEAVAEQSKTGIVSQAQLDMVSAGMNKLIHGYHSTLPLTCVGAACPMAPKCPLMLAKFTYMIGKDCPIEAGLLNAWTSNIIRELSIDPNNHIEVGLAGDLAKMDIYQMRISAKLSFEDFVQQQIVAVNDEGEPQFRAELHQAAVWDDMLSKRKLKYLEALLATRKSMASAGAGQSSDPSSNAAAVLLLLNKKKTQLKDTAETLKAEGARPTN